MFVISESSELDPTGVKISELLRKQSIDVTFSFAQGALKKQLRRADASGASLAVIIDSDLAAAESVILKPMRGQGEQARVPMKDLEQEVRKHLV